MSNGYCAVCKKIAKYTKWVKHPSGNFALCWDCRNKLAIKMKELIEKQSKDAEVFKEKAFGVERIG
jgi:hypothetical protein